MKQEKTLKIDLSDKSPQEIARFVSALLGARRILLNHKLDIRLKKKISK